MNANPQVEENPYKVGVSVFERGYPESEYPYGAKPLGDTSVDLSELIPYLDIQDWEGMYQESLPVTRVVGIGEDDAALRLYKLAREHGLCDDLSPEISEHLGWYRVSAAQNGSLHEAIRRTVLDRVATWDRGIGPAQSFFLERGDDGDAVGALCVKRHHRHAIEDYVYVGQYDTFLSAETSIDGYGFFAAPLRIDSAYNEPYYEGICSENTMDDFRGGTDDIGNPDRWYVRPHGELTPISHELDEALLEAVYRPAWGAFDLNPKAVDLLDSIARHDDPALVCEDFGVEEPWQLADMMQQDDSPERAR
jgi:hypothetical protein